MQHVWVTEFLLFLMMMPVHSTVQGAFQVKQCPNSTAVFEDVNHFSFSVEVEGVPPDPSYYTIQVLGPSPISRNHRLETLFELGGRNYIDYTRFPQFVYVMVMDDDDYDPYALGLRIIVIITRFGKWSAGHYKIIVHPSPATDSGVECNVYITLKRRPSPTPSPTMMRKETSSPASDNPKSPGRPSPTPSPTMMRKETTSPASDNPKSPDRSSSTQSPAYLTSSPSDKAKPAVSDGGIAGIVIIILVVIVIAALVVIKTTLRKV